MSRRPNLTTIALITVILFFNVRTSCQSLKYVPPLIKHGTYSDSSASFLFAVKCPEVKNPVNSKYAGALEIIDDEQPWPPRWYTSSGFLSENNQQAPAVDGQWSDGQWSAYGEEKIEAGKLFFNEIYIQKSNDLVTAEQGLVRLNKDMKAIDTFDYRTNTLIRPAGTWKSLFYFTPCYSENEHGQVLVQKHLTDAPLDLRKATQNPAYSAVISDYDDLQILDKKHRVLLDWKPTDRLNPDLFKFKENLETNYNGQRQGYVTDWSHMTNVLWTAKDDIIFCTRYIAIGEISVPAGKVVWQINSRDLPLTSGKDTLQWYSPHDLRILSENDTAMVLSLYSVGDFEGHNANGVVFNIDKRNYHPSLIKNVNTKSPVTGSGQGSFEYKENKYYLFSYGIPATKDTQEGKFHDDMEYTLFHKEPSIYQLPNYFYSDRVTKLENWPRPPRPVITQKGDVLSVEGTTSLSDFFWYTLEGPDNTQVTKLGSGNSVTAKKGVKYCVEGKYGVGFSVSNIYTAR